MTPVADRPGAGDTQRLAGDEPPPHPVADLPFAFGGPPVSGQIRSRAEDFQVDEISTVAADGSGEHCLLHLEKRNSNTDWVAGRLARLAGVPRRDVGYAGLKDRNAVTRQWFSVRLAGRAEPDWSELECDEIRLLASARHGRKLRLGALRGNRFRILVRAIHGDTDALRQRLQRIARYGIPNYFGEQRFGRDGANLRAGGALFAGQPGRVKRRQLGLYLSAARSMLFNRVLAARVRAGSWDGLLSGERLMLDGSRSTFLANEIDDALLVRLRRMDVHPTGPLWGKGDSDNSAAAAALETAALRGAEAWCAGLESFGLKRERRALRAPVRQFQWSLRETVLRLDFDLPRGSYATALLRECVDYRRPADDALAG